jgi:AraC family transcriptional regulator of adaptative response/methylated-DNA-[protein]-cysteine methyltransferase
VIETGGTEGAAEATERERVRAETLDRACDFLELNVDRNVSLDELGTEVGWSPAHLQRVFRQRLGVSPREYVEALRVGQLKQRLRERGQADHAGGESRVPDGGTASRAILDSGFNSLSSGHDAGVRNLGMTPATYGSGGRGARIEYCAVACSLGWLMVGRTGRGVCSLTLGDEPDSLLLMLREEFPEAELVEAGAAMAELCERLVGIADRGEDGLDLPVEVVATDFQWRVWRAMREIPRGETRSYSELAVTAGSAKAVRAAASACANNRISLLIPCHRVVRADGSTGQYAWGAERKRQLLATEAEATKAD